MCDESRQSITVKVNLNAFGLYILLVFEHTYLTAYMYRYQQTNNNLISNALRYTTVVYQKHVCCPEGISPYFRTVKTSCPTTWNSRWTETVKLTFLDNLTYTGIVA